MHQGNKEWLASLRMEYHVGGSSILEIGSMDWNGSARPFFKDAKRYIGVDILPGKGVDVVSKAAETSFTSGEFDILLFLSVFEHDPHWRESFSHNLQWLKPGGLIFACWGAEGNTPHEPEPWAIVHVQSFLDASAGWPIEILDRFFEGTRYTKDCVGCYNVVARKLSSESKPMAKICYVLPSWGGPRRMPDNPDITKDGALYLREHVKRASRLKGVEKVVIAAPTGQNFRPGYEEFLTQQEISKVSGPVPVEIMRRKNIGMSYGSLNDVYKRYRLQYDYYLFVEDDYLPVSSNVAVELLALMEKLPSCGFLCGLIWTNNNTLPSHAGIFLGLLRASALEAVYKQTRRLARFTNGGYWEGEYNGQVGMSQAILKAGFTLVDWLKTHRSVFLDRTVVKIFGDPKNPAFFVPAQVGQFLYSMFL